MQITVEITEKMMQQVEEIATTRTNRTLEDLLTQIVERGIYTLAYRSKHNRERYEAERELREEFKSFKARAR